MSKVIGILSGKGGVGKTTVVANLGAALTNFHDKNILIFDSNVNTSHLGLHLGIYEDLPVTLREVLNRKAPIMHAVYLHPQTGIRIIPTSLSPDGVNLTKAKCCKLVDEVKNNYDITILDCSPGLGKEVMTVVDAIDAAIIVTNPDLPAVTDAMKTIELLKKLGKPVSGIVVNRYMGERYELTLKEIMSTTGSSVIGLIHEDKKIPESVSKGVPIVLLYPHSRAAEDLKRLAANLLGEDYKGAGLFERLLGLFNFGKLFKKDERRVVQEQMIPEKTEIKDVERMREELTKDVKSELKREVMERVRKRLKERPYE